jgi:tetratricopeptide (TPR) repeat protein/nucleoside-triphosphatase THEP1
MPNRRNINHLYNPKNQSRQELEAGFVVRLPLFKRLFKEIQTSSMEFPEQHYLIEGKRGMGKTTLLLRLALEVEKDEKTRAFMLPIVFNEEEYSIRKLFRFWERVIELLAEKNGQFAPLRDRIDPLSLQIQDDQNYEKALFLDLEKSLQEKGLKMILFIDNFGDMFRKFSEHDARRLRKILQTSAEFRIFAASSVVMEAFYIYNYPFYEFFKVERLEGLKSKDTIKLLLNLAERYGKKELIEQIIKHQPGRIESLRRLSDGVIRTVILLFEIFIDEESKNALQDMESILDRVTPQYKHRMEDLSAQHQEILEVVALNWDAISVAEIRKKTRLESKNISAQLQQLVKLDLIRKIRTQSKNHLYQLSERFFNIWFLMRHGRRKDKRRVLWLVRFLEEWCDEAELEARVNKQIKMLQVGEVEENAAFLLSEALAHTSQISKEKQHELFLATKAFFEKQDSEFKDQLSQSEIQYYEEGLQALAQQEPQKALTLFGQMKHKDFHEIGRAYLQLNELKNAEEAFDKAIQAGRFEAIFQLGLVFKKQFRYSQAEVYFKRAVEQNQPEALLELGAIAMLSNDSEKAIQYFKKAIALQIPTARLQLANLYIKEGDYDAGLEQLHRAFSAGEPNVIPRLREVYTQRGEIEIAEDFLKDAGEKGKIRALTQLGKLYRKEQKFEDAKRILLEALDKDAPNANFELGMLYKVQGQYNDAKDHLQAALEDGVIESAYHLGKIYRLQGNYSQSVYYFEKAIEQGFEGANAALGQLFLRQNQFPEAEHYLLKAVQLRDSNAMKDLAMLYRKIGEESKAEAYFKKAIDNGDIDAMNKLGFLYFSLNKIELAERYFMQAAQHGNFKAYSNLGYMYHELGQFEKAEIYYKKCVDRNDPDSMNNLAYLYYEWARKKENALELSTEAYRIKPDIGNSLTHSKILAWNNQIDASLEIAQSFLFDDQMLNPHFIFYFQDYLLLLVAKGQNDFLLNYFQSEATEPFQLEDRMKPIYYALLNTEKEKHPNAYLRMGPELKETVQEILKKIKQMRKDYA